MWLKNEFIVALSCSCAAHALIRERAVDLVHNGAYSITNCPTTYSSQIVSALDNLRVALDLAVSDVKASSYAPSRAFQTFFKDPSYTPFVSAILTNISSGNSMSPPNSYSNGAPLFTCVTRTGQLSYERRTMSGAKVISDAYTTCVHSLNVPIFLLIGTMYIVVCSNLWRDQFKVSIPARNCPSVNTAINRFRGSGASLGRYLPWLLLEELVHYYLAATNAGAEPLPNIFDVNKCARLGAEQSSRNAHSYIFYAASGLPFRIFCWDLTDRLDRHIWQM